MKYSYVDIHTHVNLEAFAEDFAEVATHTLHEGVAYINVGTGEDTSARAVALVEDGVYATIGLHPVHVGRQPEEGKKPEVFERAIYEALGKKAGVVAIGECGLDYFRVEKETKEKQEEAFIAQIELANDLKKPLMLHIRDVQGSMEAYNDAIKILKTHAQVLGNVHFFAGTYDIARQFWEIGFTTSFTGVITFANQYDETIQKAPLEMLHAETDAPYVAPKPFRGQRNEPLHVREVYARIAELRGEDTDAVRIALLQNATRLFGIRFS
jgi:TatD DNase family protein